MILFEQDWLRFPSAMIDYKTTNMTWLRQAQVYRKMGIRNCAFLLALLQPELQGVDPHSETLTEDQKVMIMLECQYNPWYFFREVVRIPPQGGPKALQFRANRGNIAVFWSYFNNIDCGLIQPRQTGKSVSVDCLMVWLVYVGARNSRINMVTKDDSLRKANVDRLKGIRGYLPKFLVNTTAKDSDNMFELTCKHHNNTYNTGVGQNSESTANNLGRGLTSPTQHFDEGPFISFIGTSIPASLAGGTAAKEEAAANGMPYGNIFTTTAGKKDDRDGKYMYEMFHEAATWDEAFFDAKDKAALVTMVKTNALGRKLMINITMSHRQLGYDDQWLYNTIAETKANGEQADRDFFNVWTSGSRRSPLTVALNEAIRKSKTEVQYTEVDGEYMLRWFVPKEEIEERMATGFYVMGMDTSEAVGRDAIGLVITDIRDLSVVAVGSYNETNTIRFGKYVATLLVRYLNTVLVIERKSTGISILDSLHIELPRAGQDPFKRIFNKIVDEFQERQDNFQELQRAGLNSRSEAFYDTRKTAFGFSTNATNRTLLYTTVLQNAAKKSCNVIRDNSLISEINGLVEKNGRIDHVATGHDDLVISWLLTHWFLFHTRNLKYYGIDPMLVMSEVLGDGEEYTDDELRDRYQQAEYVREIEDLIEQLKKVNDEFLIMKLENRMRYVTSKLTGEELDSLSIDALLKQASDERLKRNRVNGATPHRGLDRPINWQQAMRR
jgi:hypothetical protein